MNTKMTELKELIKLNAEHTKYYCLRKLNDKQQARYDFLHNELYPMDDKLGYRTVSDKVLKDMRLYHIAYSMLKGRAYEQIENKVRQGNELKPKRWAIVESIKTQFGVKDEQ